MPYIQKQNVTEAKETRREGTKEGRKERRKEGRRDGEGRERTEGGKREGGRKEKKKDILKIFFLYIPLGYLLSRYFKNSIVSLQ